MGYEEQLSAAKFSAERDLARQECERLRARLRDSVPREAYERKRAAWLRQIRECEAALRKRREHIKRLENAALERRTVREEDREAAEWVREHGGLENVRDAWDEVVNLCATIGCEPNDESEMLQALGDCTDIIIKRLMPEGYEWPRYESGELVLFGDEFINAKGNASTLRTIAIKDCRDALGGAVFWKLGKGACAVTLENGERVERPAPKVLDAEGNRIEPAMDVWWICEGDERGIHAEKLHVESIGEDGLVTCSPFNGGTWVELEPSELYVNKPVPAADGKPLLKHETVYEIETGERYFITNVFDGMTEPDFPEHTVECRKYEDVVTHMFKPSQLTHERPVADTWERLEEDATKGACEYFGSKHCDCSSCEQPERSVKDCGTAKARDLVRRCKELARKENNNE